MKAAVYGTEYLYCIHNRFERIGKSEMNFFQQIAYDFTRCFITENRWQLLGKGILVTIEVSIVAVILGTIIGFLIALCNLSKNKILKTIGGI